MTDLPIQSLFQDQVPRPLADRLRPTRLSEIVGQDHVLACDAPLGRMVAEGRLASLILWGPPGVGKTTIARLFAGVGDLEFVSLSAVFSGVSDLRKVFDAASQRRSMGRGTLLFIDEIHRFNRAQQDGFLPHVESGLVTLVGATTENPSFELNPALLSRCQVFVLRRLDDAALEVLLNRVETVIGRPLPLTGQARAALRALADGDGRYLLNLTEELYAHATDDSPLNCEELSRVLQRRSPLYDKGQDNHYNLISAFHKSLRGSDPDAALYWLARMLAGGEDPGYVARRMVRFASEDIGLAAPQALSQALSAWEAFERLGSPEGDLALAQAALYLATAPKSNAAYRALQAAQKTADKSGSLAPPLHIRNAPTRLMKDLEYGRDYMYDHETPQGFSGQNYFPEEMSRPTFYTPKESGFEVEIKKRLAHWTALRQTIEQEQKHKPKHKPEQKKRQKEPNPVDSGDQD